MTVKSTIVKFHKALTFVFKAQKKFSENDYYNGSAIVKTSWKSSRIQM